MSGTIRVTNRQLALHRLFRKVGSMTQEEARKWDQRTFSSFGKRGWTTYRRDIDSFIYTEEGITAHSLCQHTDIRRANPEGPLCRYFHTTLYGLKKAS